MCAPDINEPDCRSPVPTTAHRMKNICEEYIEYVFNSFTKP